MQQRTLQRWINIRHAVQTLLYTNAATPGKACTSRLLTILRSLMRGVCSKPRLAFTRVSFDQFSSVCSEFSLSMEGSLLSPSAFCLLTWLNSTQKDGALLIQTVPKLFSETTSINRRTIFGLTQYKVVISYRTSVVGCVRALNPL